MEKQEFEDLRSRHKAKVAEKKAKMAEIKQKKTELDEIKKSLVEMNKIRKGTEYQEARAKFGIVAKPSKDKIIQDQAALIQQLKADMNYKK